MSTGTKTIRIKKGLDLPISGAPEQTIRDSKYPRHVAVLGTDFVGMKPHLSVSVGDSVKLGQPLFADRKIPAISYTSPGSGTVTEIHRGDRRALLSVVIRLEGDDQVTFNSYPDDELPSLDRKYVTGLLLQSGLWTAIRSRPFGRVADPESSPRSLFITAMDTSPLAPSVSRIIEGKERAFTNGLTVLSSLTDGAMFLCKAPGESVPLPRIDSLSVAEFSGPHPAGNAGTHIHFLNPAGRSSQVWHVNAQDAIAIGLLFTSGRLNVERVISLAGPSVMNPRLITTRLGASVDDITRGELRDGVHRQISGSVLSGHTARHELAFLGRYHQQVSVIPEGGRREFLGWLNPGLNLYSLKNIVLSRLFPGGSPRFSASAHGDRRAIVPIGSYERVMPLDVMTTYLLRALSADDIDEAQALGCLELIEEDLSLCTVVCPSKIDHGAELRRVLTRIEKEWG